MLMKVIDPPWLTVDALIAAARSRTGLLRFDDESFREPLGVLLDSINREAALSGVGLFAVWRGLVHVLSNRLRAQALVERHPEILEQPIVAPVFIVGMPRSGTTMLHRLLAADHRFRALRSWEILRPVPFRWSTRYSPDLRIGCAVIEAHAFRHAAPDLLPIHSVEAEAPEEEAAFLDHSFLSTNATSALNVASFAAWLEGQDHMPAYTHLKRLLQILQWQHSSDRWILKAPHHLEWLDTLFEVFPDATIIETHRDPLASVASLCSMVAHMRSLFSDRVDSHEIGAQWCRKAQRMIERGMETRDRIGESAFIDVSYDDVLTDPTAEIVKIYRRLGCTITSETIGGWEATLKANPQNKYGKHFYRLADFGLDAHQVDAQFFEIRARHAIRHEQKLDSTKRTRRMPPREQRPSRVGHERDRFTPQAQLGAASDPTRSGLDRDARVV
jgi:hypothetical protein